VPQDILVAMRPPNQAEESPLLESLPAASQGAVQLHDGECSVFLGDGQIELRRVVVGVVGEHFKVAGRATVMAKFGQPCGIPQQTRSDLPPAHGIPGTSGARLVHPRHS
jgi:hypothetical protein